MYFWGVQKCNCANARGKNVIWDLCFLVCSNIAWIWKYIDLCLLWALHDHYEGPLNSDIREECVSSCCHSTHSCMQEHSSPTFSRHNLFPNIHHAYASRRESQLKQITRIQDQRIQRTTTSSSASSVSFFKLNHTIVSNYTSSPEPKIFDESLREDSQTQTALFIKIISRCSFQ